MGINETAIKWIAWVLLTAAAGAWLAYSMMSESTDKSLFMPGPLSAGHHQLSERCDACHSDAFGGGEVIQQTCVDCHGNDRVKPFDSHPAKKFKDPRNADLLENINALQCISCHTEHKPELTAKDGLTQPVDVCFYCHQDVATERPSHEGMGFETCKDSGCHNFHNNRALYTNFLLKHLDESLLLGEMILPAREFVSLLDEVVDYPREKYPLKPLAEEDIDAPERLSAMTGAEKELPGKKKHWLETSHAASGVNCSACHIKQGAAMDTNSEVSTEKNPVWDDHPDHAACESCHSVEVSRFLQGKHGMRLKQGLSAMTPAQARLPMKKD
ncbi:MAG: cytochrome c3 family protein, partial [Gammaproteobacteria bacterium]|nr:cytochrome c3 family protein [Gammaproteobacteria bacterium]